VRTEGSEALARAGHGAPEAMQGGAGRCTGLYKDEQPQARRDERDSASSLCLWDVGAEVQLGAAENA